MTINIGISRIKSILYVTLALGISAAIVKVLYPLSDDTVNCDLLYGIGPTFEAITTRCCEDYDADIEEPEYGVVRPPDSFDICHAENHIDVLDCEFPKCFGKLQNIVNDNGDLINRTGMEYYFSNIETSKVELRNMYSECVKKGFANYGPHPELCDMLKLFYCKNYAELKYVEITRILEDIKINPSYYNHS